jgi:hypothetical protein
MVVARDDHEAGPVAFDLEYLRVHLGTCDKLRESLDGTFGGDASLAVEGRGFGKDDLFAVEELARLVGVFRRGGSLCDRATAAGRPNSVFVAPKSDLAPPKWVFVSLSKVSSIRRNGKLKKILFLFSTLHSLIRNFAGN